MQLSSLPGAIVRTLVDFALPPRCAGCGEIVGGPHQFCFRCWSSLTFLGPPSCTRCGLPFAFEQEAAAECGACLANPPSFDSLRAAVAYGPVARAAVLKLKYGMRPALADTLAHFMKRHAPLSGDGILFAPVPLHRWRIWTRGYNQSALMTRALAKATGGAMDVNLLLRVKATPPLKGMSPAQRRRTVAGAFRLGPAGASCIAGRHVILVDDVYTTGATVDACARLLRRAGAGRVDILCWARVVREQED